jgi:hypothetical protein
MAIGGPEEAMRGYDHIVLERREVMGLSREKSGSSSGLEQPSRRYENSETDKIVGIDVRAVGYLLGRPKRAMLKWGAFRTQVRSAECEVRGATCEVRG